MPPIHRGCARASQWPMLLALCTALLAAGCATPMNARQDASYQAQAYVADRPVVRPARSISSFSDSLACMDLMLRSAELPTTLITSKQIPDYSGRVSVGAKDMVVTALSQMSRLSNAFRFVDYEVDIARQDTVQNLTTMMLNTNQVQLQRPALYLSGAVAFVDQNVLNNRFDVGASGSRVDVAYSQNRNATIIALEMHLGDFRTRTLIPGMDSANEVVVGNGGQGFDLAGRIGSYGVQFNVGRDYTLGTGAAIRTLVDLATIELIGKWAHVPYWQCLTLEQTHPEFQRQLRDWFEQGGQAAHGPLFRRALAGRGYLRAGQERLPDDHPAVRDAIGRYQADTGLAVTGVLDYATYDRALRDFVSLGPDGTLSRIGWGPGATAPAAVLPRTLELQIENIKADRGVFEVGEQVFVSATVSRASALACYFADTRGLVLRLLPNTAAPSLWVSAGQAVRVPDWMGPNPGFIMDAATPGKEEIACFATDDGPHALPVALRGPALRPIPGYRSLDDVEKAYTQAWGAQGYSTARLQWQVEPRRTPPVAK